MLGDHKWDPRNETEKVEYYFFSWESERVKRMLKSTEMQKFVVRVESMMKEGYLLSIRSELKIYTKTTVKEIHRKMRVVKGLRWLVRRVIADCVKCRLIEKKTLELRLASHPEARTVLAPCFHSCMIDICSGFKGQTFKRPRVVIKIYALVIVCLLPGATNIMALEGIETLDVCAALECHSNWYGVPGFV